MALTSEQAGIKARAQTEENVVEGVAIKLKTLFPTINAKLGGEFVLPNPDDGKDDAEKKALECERNDELTRIARELTSTGEAKVKTKNGTTLLDTKTLAAIIPDEMKGEMDIAQLPQTKTAIKEAVGKAVEDNTNNFGLFGGAGFMNILSGLIQWLMSGFEGGFDGLKQSIAGITADNIKQSVSEQLSGKLSASEVESIAEKTRQKALKEAGYAQAAGGPAEPTLAETKFGDAGATTRDAIRAKVFDMVEPKAEAAIRTRIATAKETAKSSGTWGTFKVWAAEHVPGVNQAAGKLTGERIPDEAEIKLMSNTIATSVSHTFADQSAQHGGDMDKLIPAIKTNLGIQLAALKAKGKLPSFNEENIRLTVEESAEKVREAIANEAAALRSGAAASVASINPIKNPGVGNAREATPDDHGRPLATLPSNVGTTTTQPSLT